MASAEAGKGYAVALDLRALSPEFSPVDVVSRIYETNVLERRELPRRKAPHVVGGLTHALFSKLQPYLKSSVLVNGEFLHQQDDKIGYIYFPENAVVSEIQMLADGRTIEVAVTGNESAVGVASVWSTSSAPNSAQVCVGGSAYKIEAKILERELAYSRPLQRWLHDQINAYIRQLSQKVICNTHHSVEERFCTWLLMLQDRSKKQKFGLTHEYISSVLGVYRPSVTCMAKTLRKKEVIDYVRGQIYITDRPKLRKAACACYALQEMDSRQ